MRVAETRGSLGGRTKPHPPTVATNLQSITAPVPEGMVALRAPQVPGQTVELWEGGDKGKEGRGAAGGSFKRLANDRLPYLGSGPS